jgi:hypothetical protein
MDLLVLTYSLIAFLWYAHDMFDKMPQRNLCCNSALNHLVFSLLRDSIMYRDLIHALSCHGMCICMLLILELLGNFVVKFLP